MVGGSESCLAGVLVGVLGAGEDGWTFRCRKSEKVSHVSRILKYDRGLERSGMVFEKDGEKGSLTSCAEELGVTSSAIWLK
jgi:hypothetical protein